VDDRAPAHPAPPADALARLAEEILPALIARLDVSELGELEVRHEGWRVRLRRGASAAPPAGRSPAPPGPASAGHALTEADARTATSPGVGYYVPNGRFGVGTPVTAGDVLGWVDVLGVRQEVVAPRDGVVGRSLAEPGQAVEYGQELALIDVPRRPAGEAEPGAAG
jgi:biotin carboxyl carrier protein